jgi:YD repeat-containing protein
MLVAGQTQVSYSWDNANRLTGITQGTASVGFQYDNANRRTQLTLPNGVTVAYSYDSDSRVSGITYTAGSTQLGGLSYSYDADGRRTAIGGSLAATNLPTAVSGNTFNADNEMTAFNGTAMTYDANGNLTNDGTNTYAWDARNHLSAITGAVAASFVYGPFGRRMSKTINGASTGFLYDGLNPIQELQNGAPSANMLTGLGIDEYFQRSDSSGASSLLTDALGSTLALADSSGAIQTSYTGACPERSRREPFGNTIASGASSTNPYQFTGRENNGTATVAA